MVGNHFTTGLEGSNVFSDRFLSKEFFLGGGGGGGGGGGERNTDLFQNINLKLLLTKSET